MEGMNFLRQWNRFAGENTSLIKKALSSATGVGEALVPQSLEKEITNTIIRLSPEMALVTMKKISAKFHEFNRLSSLPSQSSAMGENGTTPTKNSTTVRDGVTLKVVRRKGAVTNFLQDTTGEYIDASAYEMENHLIAHIYDMINYILYGNKGANSYEFDGLDTLIATNRTIQARYGSTPTSLKFLDDMIDKSNRKGGAKHKRAFVMSPEMLSLVSQLLTNVRLNQGLAGTMSQVEINGGWRLNAYRDIPIVESTATSPRTTMGTVTSATATTGGTIADGTHYFKVSKVTLNGEELAFAKSQAASGGGTSTITLSFADQTDALRYKIYYGTVQNAETLIKVVNADTFDGNGTPTGRTTGVTLTTVAVDTATVGTHMTSDLAYEQDTGHAVPETVFLWDLDPIQGLGKMVYTNSGGSNFDGLVTTTPLAQTDDFLPFLIKSYTALTPAFEATSCVNRGLRTY